MGWLVELELELDWDEKTLLQVEINLEQKSWEAAG